MPPTRNTTKYCIYIIILSILSTKVLIFFICTSGSLALLGSLSASEDDLYSEKTHFCALRAGGTREEGFFFSWIDFFCQDGSNEVSHVHGKGRKVRFTPQILSYSLTQTGRIDIIIIYNLLMGPFWK